VTGQEVIGEFLARAIPKDLVLELQSQVGSVLEKVEGIAGQFDPGHRRSFQGLARHFLFNQALDHSLTECQIPHQPLKANAIVFGEVNGVTLARIHVNAGPWQNPRRSLTKLKLCEKNLAAQRVVQLDLLEEAPTTLSEVTAFFVTQGAGTPDSPIATYIAVPGPDFDVRNPLFVEPIEIFMHRYEKIEAAADQAHPRLKAGVIKARSDESA
jgi:hypothetical protein